MTLAEDRSVHSPAAPALPGVRLTSHFQPIYSLTHHRVVGHEALLRGSAGPDGAPIAPLELFARCADGAALVALDRDALSQHLTAYAGAGAGPDQWLFLNAHPASFVAADGLSAAGLGRELAARGMGPEQVVIEVLEAALPEDPSFDRAIFELRELGCLVSLDDFGAGHSNFDRVFRLRPEIVKLDRSVVVRAEIDPHAHRIAQQMVSLLHECGSLVLMEGIETDAGAYTALRCDVDFVQGDHFGAPAPRLAAPEAGQDALRVAWERFDRQSVDDDRAWQQQMAPYRQSIELASVLLAGGASLRDACKRFLAQPGAAMCYLLDARGRQVVPNVYGAGFSEETLGGEVRFAPLHDTRDARWARRPYFRSAAGSPHTAQMTRPYVTLQGRRMCVTVAIQFERGGETLVLCGDTGWSIARRPEASLQPRQWGMALKATIHKVRLQLADMDRNVYGDHELTIARHPSETDERMLMRVLAFALNVPVDRERGDLQLAKSLWDVDEPDLWQVDLTGQVVHWIEVGQPDDRRLSKASSRAEKVTVYSYIASTPIWWAALVGKLNRSPKVEVWSIAPEASQELGKLVARTMAWQVTVQDGTVWVSDTVNSVEITPTLLKARDERQY